MVLYILNVSLRQPISGAGSRTFFPSCRAALHASCPASFLCRMSGASDTLTVERKNDAHILTVEEHILYSMACAAPFQGHAFQRILLCAMGVAVAERWEMGIFNAPLRLKDTDRVSSRVADTPERGGNLRERVGMAIAVVSKGSTNLEQGSSQRSCSPSLEGIQALQKPSRLERVGNQADGTVTRSHAYTSCLLTRPRQWGRPVGLESVDSSAPDTITTGRSTVKEAVIQSSGYLS